jgi:hypothetical protein
MATTGAAKAKAKATSAAPPTIIRITDGLPNREISYVNVDGTVQFDNHDSTDYRIRLWSRKRDHHAYIDVLLPAVGGVTLMADPLAKKDDECAFDLIPSVLQQRAKSASAGGGETKETGGGGKIIIGPTPSPRKGGH